MKTTSATVACLLAACACGVMAPPGARADAIRPCEGAEVEFNVFGQGASSRGPTASESSGPREGRGELGDPSNPWPWSAVGNAVADPTGRPRGLLQVSTAYDSGNPGTANGFRGDTRVTASARWSGDAVTIQPPAGPTRPDTIRLDFGLRAAVSGENPFGDAPSGYLGSMTIRFGDEIVKFWPDVTVIGRESLDSYQYDSGDVSATFHLDLGLDDLARSNPFDLELTSDLMTGVMSNTRIRSAHAISLSLLDVTLPDGTPLDDAGYSVTFDSGLPWGASVPEPGSVAIWAATAGLGLAVRRRWRRGVNRAT